MWRGSFAVVSLLAVAVALLGVQPAAEPAATAWAASSSGAEATTADESAIDSRVERIAGADRFATAAKLAQRAAAADGGGERVWLATGTGFPDALAASASGDPVVLVTGETIPPASVDALDAIGPQQIVVAGGRSAIGDAVVDQADGLAESATARAAGAGRFATAAAVAERTHPDGADTVWLATGGGFADALAAGAVAAAEDAPLLLAAGDELPAATRQALGRLQPDEVVVVGQRHAVSAAAAEAAGEAAGQAQVTRLGGDGRFHTAAAIADRAAAGGQDDPVFVATGADFPDALAAGPAAAAAGGPLVLAVRNQLTEPTRAALEQLAAEQVVVVGGQQAISSGVADHAGQPDTTREPEPEPGVCDRYDATAGGVIQGHPEEQRPALDAWSGPWMIDHFRHGWELAVPYRWRFDVVNTEGHGGVLFYEDSEAGGGDPYAHRYALTVFCGDPFLVAGGRELGDDTAEVADHGPHSVLGRPDVERTNRPGVVYSAQWHDLGNPNPADDLVQRYDYVTVGGDVLMLHYAMENRFARDHAGQTGRIADAVTASIGAAGHVACPTNAGSCRTDRDRTQGGTPP